MDIEYDEDLKKQLNEQNRIGFGAYGIVYKIHKGDKDYAIKVIDLAKLGEKQIKSVNNEINTLTKINHENIVKYYKSFKDNNTYYIVMEYCNFSDLGKFIIKKRNEKSPIDNNVIYSIILDICLGIKEIHKENIIHRDLKPENIFINKDYKIKIGDFGIAKEIGGTIHHTANKGTYEYTAPEIIDVDSLGNNNEINKKSEYDTRADIWSFGCIIYELCTLNQCFNVIKVISKSYNYPKLETKKEFQIIIDKLLIIDPEKRPNINQVYELIKNLNIPNFNFDEKYLKSLDNISRNILERLKLQSPNQIIINITVKQKDISKKIYFLENDYYLQNNISYQYENYNKEIKELNEEKVELYINGEDKTKNFNKYFIPDEEGEYEIKIIFKNKLKDCRYMFRNCMNIKSVDLSSFDSSDVTNMNYMFGKCIYLEDIKLNNLVTDKVTDMSYMFNKCKNLKKLNFPSSFNTKNVEKMDFMFHDCQNLSELKFPSSFKTNNVTTMRSMFKRCYNLKNIDLTNFTSEKLLDMGYMFDECLNLEKITLNKEFKTNLVTNMIYLFNECCNLKEINIPGISTTSSNINLSSFNTENVEFLDYMFCNCKELKNIDLSTFNIKETANMTHSFENCGNLKQLNLSSFKNINNKSKINNMFDNLSNIEEIKVNKDSIDYLKEYFSNIKEKFIA